LSRIVAELLRQKAQGDFSAAVVLANAEPHMDDETVGLHLQQAAEKAAKALLAERGIKYPFTHDLSVLLRLLADHRGPVPERFADLDALTPFATQARYERVIPAGSFDRTTFLALVRDFLAWANAPG
jgi:HEPN domain-containing protein